MSDIPARYGQSDMYRNPNGTLPMPSPQDVPRPLWGNDGCEFAWEEVFVSDGTGVPPETQAYPPGVMYTYTWTSPVFDLRPDLRSANGAPKVGVPIWSTSARLYLQLMAPSNGAGAQPALDMSWTTATAQDFTEVYANQQPANGASTGKVPGGATYNVSALFTTAPGQQSLLVGFSPPGTNLGFGTGYPVRYWRLAVIFTKFVPFNLPVPNPLPVPVPITLQAAVY